MLCLQDVLGARFFLPGRFFPAEQRWDYHPSVPPTDVETPGKVPVCNICFEGIDVPAGGEDAGYAATSGTGDGPIEGLGRTLNRRSFMVRSPFGAKGLWQAQKDVGRSRLATISRIPNASRAGWPSSSNGPSS